MLLSEKKVWKIVNGEHAYPKTAAEYEADLAEDEKAKLTDATCRKVQKEYDEWAEKDEEALHIISFTVSDQLQGPIHYSKTAKGAWDELQRIDATNDKQRKLSLMKRPYRLDMNTNGSLIKHERVFDDLVQSLTAIGKTIDPEELIILYLNSLSAKIFGNWIQGQMAFIDKMTITEFKDHVREEACHLNSCGLSEASVERDSDTVQANVAKRIFPPKKGGKPNIYPPCSHCGYLNHDEKDCYKRIAEEYFIKEARKAYNSIFSGLTFCLKAAINGRIRKVRGVWIKDNGTTHHMHHDKSFFLNYHHPVDCRKWIRHIKKAHI